jgi:hypothetical protein
MASVDTSSLPPWRASIAEVDRAEALLAEDPAAVAEVARHLHEAWAQLHRELYGHAEADPAIAQLADRYHAPTFAGEAIARRLVFADPESDEAATLADAPELPVGLAREAAVLRRAAEEIGSRRDGSAWIGIGFVITVMVLLAFSPLIGDLGGTVTAPWRGAYYGNSKFEGEAREKFERTLELEFGKDSPLRGIGADDFSIRFDTCLRIDEETKARFEITSDDGSRLYVDGEMVVDNWGDHGTETRTGSTTLAPGMHHVEVEYYEARHGANLKVQASLDGGKPAPIPVELLAAPGEGDEPCP